MRRAPSAAASIAGLALTAGCALFTEEPTPASDWRIAWTTGTPSIPTDPREQAVWYRDIERPYAGNMLNFVRPEYANVATQARISSAIQVSEHDLMVGKALGVNVGPNPKAFLSVEDGDTPDTATVTYCATELWVPYSGQALTQTETGKVYAVEVVRGDDGDWRVNKTGGGSLAECSLKGADVGYFNPRPKPSPPGARDRSDLVAPTWYKEAKESRRSLASDTGGRSVRGAHEGGPL